MKIENQHGFRVWSESRGNVEVRFTGRGPTLTSAETLAAIEPGGPKVAFAKQIHSSVVLRGCPGNSGEGDALTTSTSNLALSILTADCVPVLIATGSAVAAVHAGWRGIAGEVVNESIRSLSGSEASMEAWIGPSIGACCYEVGSDVADRVVTSSHARFARSGTTGRPHLDLQGAVAYQLEQAGVSRVTRVESCTRCHAESLWSYRRDGAGAGRNLAYIWRRPEGSGAG